MSTGPPSEPPRSTKSGFNPQDCAVCYQEEVLRIAKKQKMDQGNNSRDGVVPPSTLNLDIQENIPDREFLEHYTNINNAVLTTITIRVARGSMASFLRCFIGIMRALATIRKAIDERCSKTEFMREMRYLIEINGPTNMLILDAFKVAAMQMAVYDKDKLRDILMKVLMDLCQYGIATRFSL